MSNVFLNGVGLEAKGTIPHVLFMAFQGTFCIITAALISGAIVERMRFSAYVAFISLWAVVVYAPIAHWVWGGGWLAKMGALDFAGGTVVHVNAAVAAFVAALVVGKRHGLRSDVDPAAQRAVRAARRRPAVVWLVRFQRRQRAGGEPDCRSGVRDDDAGAGGDAGGVDDPRRGANGQADRRRCATAIVVGLVAVTPAAGFISPMNALILGGIAAIPSYFAILLRAKTSLDDSLDVVAAHGVGGTVGALLTGVFAEKSSTRVADGLLYGNPGQVLIQGTAVLAAIVYSGVASFILLKLIGLVIPLTATTAEQVEGLDISAHGEEAYMHASGAAMIESSVSGPAEQPALKPVRSEV